MGIEEVAVGAALLLVCAVCDEAVLGQRELVVDELVGMVAIEEPCPETNLPAHRPSRRRVATMDERRAGGIEELRRAVRRDLCSGEHPIEMTHMTVCVVRVVPVFEPLLQLSPSSDLQGCHLTEACGIVVVELLVHAQHLAGGNDAVEELVDQLVVHGGPVGDGDAAIGRRMTVLGRHRGRDHQPAMCRFGNEHGIEKLCRTLHDGIGLLQKPAVAGIEVMLPQVGTEPCAAGHPHATGGSVYASGDAPDVGVVVGHPSLLAIHHLRRLGTALAHLADEPEQRLVEVRQACHLGRPVVHLQVDVGGVLAVPGRCQLVVPDALQVGGLSSGLRGTDEQVTAEGEIGRHEPVVVVVGKVDDALVGGQVGVAVVAQEERCASHETAELPHMGLTALLIVARHGLPQPVFRPRLLVARDIRVVDEVGGDGDVDHGLVGLVHADDAVARGRRPACPTLHGGAGHASHEPHLPLAAFQRSPHTFEGGFIALALDDDVGVWCGKVDVEGNHAWLRGGETNGDHIVGKGGDDLPPILHAVHRVGGHGQGRVEAQLTPVLRIALGLRHRDIHIAEGLVGHTPVGGRHHLLRGHVLRFLVLSFEEQPLDYRDGLSGLRIGILVGLPRPDGLLVELHMLGRGDAIDHGAQSAIAKREGIGPHLCRTVIP